MTGLAKIQQLRRKFKKLHEIRSTIAKYTLAVSGGLMLMSMVGMHLMNPFLTFGSILATMVVMSVSLLVLVGTDSFGGLLAWLTEKVENNLKEEVKGLDEATRNKIARIACQEFRQFLAQHRAKILGDPEVKRTRDGNILLYDNQASTVTVCPSSLQHGHTRITFGNYSNSTPLDVWLSPNDWPSYALARITLHLLCSMEVEPVTQETLFATVFPHLCDDHQLSRADKPGVEAERGLSRLTGNATDGHNAESGEQLSVKVTQT